jgi:hypothetical protein
MLKTQDTASESAAVIGISLGTIVVPSQPGVWHKTGKQGPHQTE